MATKMDDVAHVEAHGSEHTEKEDYHSKDGAAGDAQLANLNEHSTTVRQAIRAYPFAVVWTLLVSMSIIMEGYDTQLMPSFFGFTSFRLQFGEYSNVSKDYQIAGKWQSALGSGAQAGCIVGATLNGWMIHRWGYKVVFMFGLILMNGFIFISFFGKTIEIQTVGQVLSG